MECLPTKSCHMIEKNERVLNAQIQKYVVARSLPEESLQPNWKQYTKV